jgi:hypothetical protein
MTIRRAEFLVFVAIVTSAAVMQIRERTLTPPPQQATDAIACNAVRQGVVPAGCAVKRDDERHVDGAVLPRHHEPDIWV